MNLQFFRLRLNQGLGALALLVVIEVLTNSLSQDLLISRVAQEQQLLQRQPVYGYWVVFIVALLVLTLVLWMLNDSRRLRMAIFFLNGLFTVQLFLAAVIVVVRLMQKVELGVASLIVDAIILFITNILIFALWYWFIETGNTRLLRPTAGPPWDFLFPQRQAEYPGYGSWEPRFIDYLFIAYTTSVAFSPTDTAPLSRAAKLLMMAQSAISLVAIVAVAGTAINGLAGGA